MIRQTRHEMLTEIKTRFANRALTDQEVPQEVLEALVEAASHAPSCFNEQPWRFLIATGERRERLLATLTEQNQEWAGRAPVLVLTLSKKTFTQGGRDNYWHMSDAGCATGFFMLEAERRGLTAHPMAGFSRKQAREAFQIPEEYDIVHVMAVGWPGDLHLLSEKNQARNHPRSRKPIEELLL